MTAAPTRLGQLEWAAPAPVPPDRRRAFGERLAYCLPEGDRELAGDFACEYAAEATTVRYRAEPEARERVEALLEQAYRRTLEGTAPTRQVLADTVGAAETVRSAGAAESEHDDGGRGGITGVGPGLRVATAAMAVLVRALDELFLDLALDLGAQECSVPALVSWETLDRAGYARNSPQHLTSCAVVRHDLGALDRFASAETAAARAAELEPAPVALAPSVCLNLFAVLADSAPQLPLLVTARGMCARYEAGAERSPTRLWSFSMREVVCVGDQATVRRFRDDAVAQFGALAADLGLPARVVTSNDPFFTREAAQLSSFQSAFALKHELCAVPHGDGPELAVASANLHNRHFGLGFGIRAADGGAADSACVGFGLERWAHWVAGHYGTEPDGWPEPLRIRALRPARGDLPGRPRTEGG